MRGSCLNPLGGGYFNSTIFLVWTNSPACIWSSVEYNLRKRVWRSVPWCGRSWIPQLLTLIFRRIWLERPYDGRTPVWWILFRWIVSGQVKSKLTWSRRRRTQQNTSSSSNSSSQPPVFSGNGAGTNRRGLCVSFVITYVDWYSVVQLVVGKMSQGQSPAVARHRGIRFFPPT